MKLDGDIFENLQDIVNIFGNSTILFIENISENEPNL